jgi:mannose-6-phosphate isomerase-like protein (cupin superfamily)
MYTARGELPARGGRESLASGLEPRRRNPVRSAFGGVTCRTWSRPEMRALQKRSPRAYAEAFRNRALSFGVYALPRGGVDPQRPHLEDELYFVLSGRADLVADGRRRTLRAGAVAFVAARVKHRFERVGRNFVVAVAFAPPESEPAPRARARQVVA